MERPQGNYQVAVDTGGTFTDVAVRKPDGEIFVWKVPSTPDAPDDAVLDGVRGAFAEIDGDVKAINRFVHGTTVATNTVITRTGARVGLVTTEGFRDILEIAYQTRPSLYDARVRRPAPLVLRDHIYEVSERIDADGGVLNAIDLAQVEKLASRIKAQEFDVVVVAFLNSYLDPTHEDQVVESLRALDAAPFVFASSDISPEMREYDRFSTAAISAYVQPKIAGYLRRLEKRVAGEGVPANMWIMQSNGGLLSPEDASRRSARTILSGLAGGVVGAANWVKGLGLDRVVSFDIGGTSTDIALIRNGEPDETISGTIDDMPVQLPSVDVHTIGAGGGSIAWLDSGGGMRVGPHSAGSVPGPISYQRGGTELTVTDAHAVLGRLGENLLGGRFKLDIEKATDNFVDVRERILDIQLSAQIVDNISKALEQLISGASTDYVAVRSSSSAEDSALASGAGQHDSFLAVRGVEQVCQAILRCWASMWSERAVAYRNRQPSSENLLDMAVLVQRFVDADVSGIMFTGATSVVEASWGLGERIVAGELTPDSWRVAGAKILDQRRGDQTQRTDRIDNVLQTGPVAPAERQKKACLTDDDVLRLDALGHAVSTTLGGNRDIEWAIDGDTIWILQARPITSELPNFSSPRLPTADGNTIAGEPASPGIATGPVRLIRGPADFATVEAGDVIVCRTTDPAWTPLFSLAAAVVTETGGVLSHAAIVAREVGIPAVLAVPQATKLLKPALMVTVDGDTGSITTFDS